MAGPVHIYISCLHHCRPPPMPPVHASQRQSDGPSPKGEIPLEPTIASLAAAQGVTPDTAALRFDQSPIMDPILKMGMLVSFGLTTVFLGAKYYFERQVVDDSSADAAVNVAVAAISIACVCGLGCALSMCCAKPTPRQVWAARADHGTPRGSTTAARV